MLGQISYLACVQAVDNFPYHATATRGYYRLLLPLVQEPYGFLHLGAVLSMPWTKSFVVDHRTKRVSVLPDLTYEDEDVSQIVTAAFGELVNRIIEQNVFRCIAGRHSEPFLMPNLPYRVVIERFACSIFGIATRGAHLTAYTRSANALVEDEMKIWVPRRSQHVGTWKGKLDSTVAGGVAADELPYQNILREAAEEASLQVDLIKSKIRQTGLLTYMGRSIEGENGWEGGMVLPDIVSVFDLELSESVIPKPCDDEVQEYYLMSVRDVQKAVLAGEFKPNSAVVMIDFFIRHGIITMENEPDYMEIVSRMHRRIVESSRAGGDCREDESQAVHKGSALAQLIDDWQTQQDVSC